MQAQGGVRGPAEEVPEPGNPHRQERAVTDPTPAPRLGEGLGFAARRLPRRQLAEEEAEAAAHALHQPAAAGAGGDLPEEPLPRHEYAGRDRRVDQPHRGPRAGTPPPTPRAATLTPSRAAPQVASEPASCSSALPAPSSDPTPDVPRPRPLPARPSFRQPPISALPASFHSRRRAPSPLALSLVPLFTSPRPDPAAHPRSPVAPDSVLRQTVSFSAR